MSQNGLKNLARLMRGLLIAIAFTLLCMAGIAALAVFARISDEWIGALNQALKFAAILLGVTAAVGRGGERGFLTGMALATLYMALGYSLAVALGGNAFAVPDLLGEILIGAAAGGIAGAVLSNLPKRRVGSRRQTA